MIISDFPREILQQSVIDRCNYFEREILLHTSMEKALNELNANILSQQKPIIAVYGPTRCGKTALIKAFYKNYFQAQEGKGIEPGTIPIIASEVKPPKNGKFRWKSFFERILISLEEPMIKNKIRYIEAMYQDPSGKLIIKSTAKEDDLDKALEKALIHRKVQVLLLDEAHHLGLVSSGESLRNQLEILKSMANLTKTKIVLVGTYDLLPLLNMSDQLASRVSEVHFPRYVCDVQEDVNDFVNVLDQFFKKLPMRDQKDLSKNWEFFLERSFGCIGQLHILFSEALRRTLNSNADANTITLKMFERCSLTAAQGTTIANNIALGEASLSENSWSNIRDILKRTQQDKGPKPKGRNSNRKPGERLPKRDDVGMAQHQKLG